MVYHPKPEGEVERAVAEFVGILFRIILPVFLVIGSGYLIQKRLSFDLSGFTKILFYILIPCLIFSRLYKTDLPLWSLGKAFLFAVTGIVISGGIALGVSLARSYPQSMRSAFALSVMFCNSGNYGLPVIELVFDHNPVATSLQILVLTAQNILTFTLGVFLVARGRSSFRESLGQTLRFPSLYAIILALVFRVFRIPLWQPLWIPIEMMASALVPAALLTLGMQLARAELTRGLDNVALSSFCRLILGPAVALPLLLFFGYRGLPAQALLISSGMPTAVNTALLAIEMDNEPRFASQAVLFSTLLSTLTVSYTIFGAERLFT
jgi:predicted permease